MGIATLKRLLLLLFIVNSSLFVKAQQVHFVYLQTENGQPFYVKMDKQVISSSAAGYLILPKLIDGNYKLSVGFPKKEFPEEDFQIVVDKKNEGFLLKNFGEKGWGLFNMQSFGIVMGGGTNAPDTTSKVLQSDPFARMLANVVKDSSILQRNQPKEEPIKEVVSPAKTDSAVAAVEPQPLLLSPAKKLLSEKNKDGMEMVYIDPGENGNDTIRIFIPGEKAVAKNETLKTVDLTQKPVEAPREDTTLIKDTSDFKQSIAINDSVGAKDTALVNNSANATKIDSDTTASITPLVSENKNPVGNNDSNLVKKDEEIKQQADEVKPPQPSFIQQDSTTKEAIKPAKTKNESIEVLPEVVKSSATNSDCKAFADNGDFLKLRKKMASESSDDNMIKIAKKVFHSKCFSTEQIKNLSFLFLTDEGKYKFFDEAYAFVSDSDQYVTLQSQFTDSYYLNRFKAMIHK